MKTRYEVQAIIFDEESGEKKAFLIHVYDPKTKKRTWRLVKGGIEKGETDEQALKREIMEEVTLADVQPIKKIYNYDFVHEDTHHMVASYLVKGNMSEKPKLNMDGSREIIDSRWVSPKDAIRLLFWDNEKHVVGLLK
ncbi:MAG: NUDIX hydrolase [Candidatus Aenigmarchaeota archaeon]|nr:NUDIX hydrolase [Candidatus Aenigmarchaeota archaeon]